MKAMTIYVIIILLCFALVTSSLRGDEEKLLKLQKIQEILNTKNPLCVVYRDAVNAYFRVILPDRKCQLQCNNLDSQYASKFANWYIPNNMPVESKDCANSVDNCNYKFDSENMFGNKFYEVMLDADIFITVIMSKSYLSFCLS